MKLVGFYSDFRLLGVFRGIQGALDELKMVRFSSKKPQKYTLGGGAYLGKLPWERTVLNPHPPKSTPITYPAKVLVDPLGP